MDIAKSLRTAFFIEHIRCLLLTALLQYNKVSWSVYSLILHPQVLSILMKILQNIAQIILFYHVTKQFLPCLNLLISHAFNFRLCFGKTLVAFNFDEKLTQSVTQKTM